MSKNYALKAEERAEAGKGIARALRRENKIPAVIYGDKKAPITITLPNKETSLEYSKGQMFTTLCDLEVGGEKHLVLARDIQLHPVSDNVLHIDFLRVTAKTKLNVMVPVHFIGEEESPGIKEKGIVNVIRHEIELLCSATHIPDSVIIDMSEMDIGDTVKTDDVKLTEGATIADPITRTICTMTAPRTMEEIEEGEVDAVVEGEEGEEGEVAEGEEGETAEASEGDEKADSKE